MCVYNFDHYADCADYREDNMNKTKIHSHRSLNTARAAQLDQLPLAEYITIPIKERNSWVSLIQQAKDKVFVTRRVDNSDTIKIMRAK